MTVNTHVNWTGNTWNPWMGCRKVSPGCKFCYMYRDMERYGRDPKAVTRTSPATFNAPLKWKESAKVFTCSWSDFFIEEADEWRNDAWEIIRKTPHLTYQILTKRPERILDHLPKYGWMRDFKNVWLGVSVENQEQAEKRIPKLLEVNVASGVRFLSCEPLLGPLDLSNYMSECDWFGDGPCMYHLPGQGISWVITGGESGSRDKARPAQIDWFRSLRDQCQQAGVAYWHKQHGGSSKVNGEWGGRELDGVEWNEFPETA